MQDYRIFISSPADVAVERQRTEKVVSRLNGEFAGIARLTAVRWETDVYKAHATFQTQIPPAAACDVVIGILKWRLGTPLPPDFPDQLPGGEPYPSGTAYEILSAVEQRRSGGERPDVFVFRYAGGAPSLRLDDPGRLSIERDWATLGGFFERWFLTSDGRFQAAFNRYRSEDDFEHRLEGLLRQWLADRVAGGRVVAWPATKGSPFRGLSVFGAKHASVFFGRSADVRQATDLWLDYARRGQRFLLLVGASGAGKSSLARAGLIPRLATPGVVADVDLWRIAVMRPSDSPDGPFAALAAALLQPAETLPSEEDGRGPALPEIAEGDSKTPAELAAVLQHADAGAVRPILNALARIAERTRIAERYDRDLRCDLVLLVDQLDELFAPSLAADVRERFAGLMAALVGSGRVWLVTTLRADLYAAMLEVPALKGLKDHGASYDLAPPGAAELAEIVREPAKAAALTFEKDPATGERLDERLLREADRPDMLPLVQLALGRLWDAREAKDGATLLPMAAFDRLGGVKGIVAEAGETALAKVTGSTQAELGSLIRKLATQSRAAGSGTAGVTARAIALAEATPDATSKALVAAFVEARLMTVSNAGSGASLRLAHQRVLSDWPRVAAIVVESADFYRVRDEVEEQRRRWEAGNRRSELLLARGLPLAEARAMADKYRRELAPETLAFVAASGRRANRAQVVGWGVAAAFALVAIGASAAAKLALDQRAVAVAEKRQAERNFATAKETLHNLMFGITTGMKESHSAFETGARGILLQGMIDTVDTLLAVAPNDPDLISDKWEISEEDVKNLSEFTSTLDAAERAADRALATARRLAEIEPANVEPLHDIAYSLKMIAILKEQAGKPVVALATYQEALTEARKVALKKPNDLDGQTDILADLDGIGHLKLVSGDLAGALAAYREALPIARKVAVDHDNDDERLEVGHLLGRIAEVELYEGATARALADLEESNGIVRALVAETPNNGEALWVLALVMHDTGNAKLRRGDRPGALAAYRDSSAFAEKVAALEPSDLPKLRECLILLHRISASDLEAADPNAALAADEAGLAIARSLATQRFAGPNAKTDLAEALVGTAWIDLMVKDYAAAVSRSSEALAIAPDMLVIETNRAHGLMMLGRTAEARALYLKYRGKPVVGMTWEKVIEADFTALRKAGISDPLMDEIAKDFAG